jgi:hypothetical protein
MKNSADAKKISCFQPTLLRRVARLFEPKTFYTSQDRLLKRILPALALCSGMPHLAELFVLKHRSKLKRRTFAYHHSSSISPGTSLPSSLRYYSGSVGGIVMQVVCLRFHFSPIRVPSRAKSRTRTSRGESFSGYSVHYFECLQDVLRRFAKDKAKALGVFK